MTTKATKPKQTASLNLERLSQSDAAWLVDRRASWLRDRPNLIRRNDDGTYNGKALVAAMIDNGEPAELSDEHLTAVVRLAECAYELSHAMPGCVRVLREIVKEHGTAGLAAVGQVLLDTCEEILRELPGCHAIETADEIRTRGEAAIDAQIEKLATTKAIRDMHFVEGCDSCERYRWGSSWKPLPLPLGYVMDDGRTRCPNCRQKHGR